ncbi:hypothetical protein D3C71_2093650 [compost metagenome]
MASGARDLPAAQDLLYQESIGQQIAYVARHSRSDAQAPSAEGAVQLELLYKALSLNRDSMLAALASSQQASPDLEQA